MNATSFNEDIGSWNTAAVTRMNLMFRNATSFNQDIGSWNTAKVTRMDNMFYDATSFNQYIRSWDVSKVTNFGNMFGGATAMISTFTGVTGFGTTPLSTFFNIDSTNPTLSSSSPADNATDVARDANIVLNFSESVDVESGNITIKKTSGNSTVETIDVTSGQVTGTGTSQITVNPSVTLDSSTEYYVLIDATAFDDSADNSYAGISSTTALSFTTVDNTLPTLSSSSPADNATAVDVNANIVLNFDESVDVETGNITIKKTSDDSTVETISVTGGLVSGSGSSQITVNPSSTLDSETEYYVLIDATAFDDSSNNSYAGISSTTALSFTTADVVNPTLSSSSPADNATDVARDANIVLNFSESVDVESGNITIKKTSDNSTVETFNVATSGQVTGTGTSQITINPTSDFIAGIEYYVLIDATAFDDSAGNSYAGISSTTALSFTVVAMQDPTTDKDVVGSIDIQSKLAKSYIIKSTSTVSSRLSYLRKNKDSNDLSKNNIKLDFGNAILTSLTNELLAKNDKSIIPDNWSSWSEGSISVLKRGDRTNSSSSETDGQALALGFDTKLNDNDLFGFAIQYGKSDTDVGSSGTDVDSENINVSVYRTRPLNDNNFIEGMFGIGLIESDLTRISEVNTLTGSRNGTQVFGSINYGKTFDKGDFNLTPIARVDLGYTELDAYSETGTNALSYTKQTIESGLASVGLQFSDMVKFNENKLKPFGSIEYGMDFSNSSNAKMNYVSDTSTIYTYTQGANSNHLITTVVGFEFITINNLNIISSYKRVQGNESEQTDIINVSINFRSQRETEYAMSVDGSEDLKAGFDITKNINGFDLKFNANQSLSENSDKAANVSLSRSF
ncbi:Ig-like domain-containing protein [Candidatus Pelagibacter bacterium]|nr:Ig-like domain-containing protein [Candidatus Pelagibacter bacterium]